ncbi:hypothetical protein BO83DRAFT_245560 [Aspergillus eucalypticola CBS 122712]|uniref:Uncharacterized protein n=1 Tax=Aspergillus eucalypticola (strain CBS 122712 / IBT 29274) TaxID=1448314 RepID=A0A317VV00_ASPEC|nr:uncharacterized protein BO83DRAFT_245560 [Aspergillus eucalypticola CBS 122712]PWY75700.1 hypothetical protein BO83DRAFT_245560 [Aspergillus eucalypticola CBS 122712]
MHKWRSSRSFDTSLMLIGPCVIIVGSLGLLTLPLVINRVWSYFCHGLAPQQRPQIRQYRCRLHENDIKKAGGKLGWLLAI